MEIDDSLQKYRELPTNLPENFIYEANTFCKIAALKESRIPVAFYGIVTNIFDGHTHNVGIEFGKGKYFHVVLNDNTGTVTVRIHHNENSQPYDVQLGTKLSVWPRTVGQADQIVRTQKKSPKAFYVEVYPDIAKGGYITLFKSGPCHSDAPIYSLQPRYKHLKTLSDLIGVKDENAKANIVAVMESMREKYSDDDAEGDDVLEIRLIDHSVTGEDHVLLIVPTLFRSAFKALARYKTILFIQGAKLQSDQTITLSPSSQLFINPLGIEAHPIQTYAQSFWFGCNVDIPRSLELTEEIPVITATLDQIARYWNNPSPCPVALRASAVLRGLNLTKLYEERRMFCMPCRRCGRAIFANARVMACKHCQVFGSQSEFGMPAQLRLNPQIIEAISDETCEIFTDVEMVEGIMKTPTFFVKDSVWLHLLGMMPAELEWCIYQSSTVVNKLKEIEDRLRGLRLTFYFMWSGTLGGGWLVLSEVISMK